jgi:4-amino-4-deoxy-L-arabinose transferase-like glycosyltransferase
MKIDRKIVTLIGAALAVTLGLCISQSAALRGDPWWHAGIFWPNFFSFLIPTLLAFGMVEICNRLFLRGDGTAFARRCVWWALGLRLAFLLIAPIALAVWGYASNRNLKGLVELDAINATDTAWAASRTPGPVLASWKQAPGDNTGGITVLGAAVFRMCSPDVERTLLLGLAASAFTSLSVIAVYRLAGGLFSSGTARAAAVIAAAFPEAVMIGSSHQQLGYVALLFCLELLAVAALTSQKEEVADGSGLPGRRNAAILLAVALITMFFVSRLFFLLAVVAGVVLAVWLTDPRKRIGRVIWIAAGLAAGLLIVVRILGMLDVIPSNWDFLFLQYQYVYGMAWEEFDKMVAAGGGDLFQTVLATMDRTPAFLLAAVYGIAQPVLPAAIGHRNLTEGGGAFWQVLGIYRGLGWYLLLPVLIYGTLKSLRGILARKGGAVFMLIFWGVALLGSYRAFGDQWDNPRYRLFALAPMALLAAWAWMTQRETGDPWFKRIVIPFAVAVVSLTVWYLMRDYALLDFPVVGSIIVIGAVTIGAFLITWFFTRRKKSVSAG